jgi:hypothetical protein
MEDPVMKFKSFFALSVVLMVVVFIQPSALLAFDSGSTGADGAFAPASNTALQVPESGIFNFTTVNIASGVTVAFIKNSKNTPVVILASGNVTISGTININGTNGSYITPGAGGAGGYDGGQGAPPKQYGQRGSGPGGGSGGAPKMNSASGGGSGGGGGSSGSGGVGNSAYTDSPGGAGGIAYGNDKIIPTIGGSGGGGGGGTTAWSGGAGGGGGGAIVIASSGTIIINGAITANGGAGVNGEHGDGGGGGGGSGGSIRLIANTISGTGSFYANGGSGGAGFVGYNAGAGSAGRIRFEADALTRSGGSCSPAYTYALPNDVVPSNAPTLTIASVAGVNAPAVPRGSMSSPDIVLPAITQNPVTVVLTGTNIPVGTVVTLKASPSIGSATSVTGILEGADASSTSASVQITISTVYPSVFTASVTFQLAALNMGPIYAGGEPVEKVRVEANLGNTSEITYITASGKEIPVKRQKS